MIAVDLYGEEISRMAYEIAFATRYSLTGHGATVAGSFLLISKMPRHNISIGAALPYIQEFLSKPDI